VDGMEGRKKKGENTIGAIGRLADYEGGCRANALLSIRPRDPFLTTEKLAISRGARSL